MDIKKLESTDKADESKEIEQEKLFLEGIIKYLEDNESISKEIFDSMSHELRTPTVTIKAYTEMLLEGKFGDLTKIQHEKLERIKTNTELLLDVIFKMLEKKESKN